eukprot:gnl/Hemi2/12316_TR4214_c1_g9_i1.p1 gnl/Hemi2/12316_TR4214_c1_g9~~gnl/Hemi2/12316_TR4214_c1_g9_i1.p1  ORF type:complete len:240 (-),score=54.83 gnl/Hemi2/12316_TR4214_c1_g9_i1:41-760(-)
MIMRLRLSLACVLLCSWIALLAVPVSADLDFFDLRTVSCSAWTAMLENHFRTGATQSSNCWVVQVEPSCHVTTYKVKEIADELCYPPHVTCNNDYHVYYNFGSPILLNENDDDFGPRWKVTLSRTGKVFFPDASQRTHSFDDSMSVCFWTVSTKAIFRLMFANDRNTPYEQKAAEIGDALIGYLNNGLDEEGIPVDGSELITAVAESVVLHEIPFNHMTSYKERAPWMITKFGRESCYQ